MNQNIQFSFPDKVLEGSVDFALAGDIAGGGENLNAGELILDRGLGVEKGLFSSPKDGDS